jgi:hypothetical protein
VHIERERRKKKEEEEEENLLHSRGYVTKMKKSLLTSSFLANAGRQRENI